MSNKNLGITNNDQKLFQQTFEGIKVVLLSFSPPALVIISQCWILLSQVSHLLNIKQCFWVELDLTAAQTRSLSL